MATKKQKPKKERVIRPYELRLEELDKKIAYHEQAIEKLKARKDKMQNPPLSRDERKSIITAAAQSGFSPEEIAEILEKAKKEKVTDSE